MHPSGETFDEILIGTIDTVRPILLGLEKENSIHIYPVTRSLANATYKVFDLYAAHHLLGSIEMREMHKGRMLITYIPKRFNERQIQLGMVPREVLPLYEQFVSAFRQRIRSSGFECVMEPALR